MHVADLGRGMLGADGIVGGGPPLACGAALGARTLGTGAVTHGTMAGSLDLAMVWCLPALLVIEDDGWGEATSAEWAVAGDVVERARGHGMAAERVDGPSLSQVHEEARTAAARAWAGEGPSLLHVSTERFHGHSRGDPDTHRGDGTEAAQRRDRDRLLRLRVAAVEGGLLEAEALDATDAEVAGEIEVAVAAARAAPRPDPAPFVTDAPIDDEEA